MNCDSYENADLGDGTTTAGGNADGFAPKLDVGDTVIFRSCRAWLNSDDGWDGFLGATAITDNMTTFLEDCWTFSNGYYWLDGSTNASQNGNGFKMGGSNTKSLSHNFVLIKCLSFLNKANGFDQNSNAGSIYLYNNSAYKNLGSDYFLNSPTVIYKAGAELVLKNNMSLGPRGVSIPASSTSTRSLTTVNNSFSTATSHPEILSFDTTGVTGMRKLDGSLPDINFMHLNAAAPKPYTYIDKGTVLSNVVYHDTVGVPYNGAAPDLGAFEVANATLATKLLSFSAFSDAKGVTLNWSTTTENNTKGWSIERATSSTNTSWTTVGFVEEKNTISSFTSYSYLDKSVANGMYYYRLKQVDVDNRITYSNIMLVKVGNASQQATIAVFPNPFKASTTIRYNVPTAGKVSLALYNQEGSLINTLTEGEQGAGVYQKLFNGETLARGRYYLKLIIGEQMVSNSLIKE